MAAAYEQDYDDLFVDDRQLLSSLGHRFDLSEAPEHGRHDDYASLYGADVPQRQSTYEISVLAMKSAAQNAIGSAARATRPAWAWLRQTLPRIDYPASIQNSAKAYWAALYPKDYDDPLYQDDESIASFMESLIPIPFDQTKRRILISKSQNLAEARELFYAGADLDEFDENHRSPLIAAARKGNLDLAKWLIAKKASIELRDNKSHGPLWHAFRKSSAEVAELLIQNGAKIDAVSKSGSTPFQRAAESEMLGAVAWMLESMSMRPPRTFGSALHILAHFPMDHVLNWILSASPAIDFTLRNRHGEMAHEYMARLGHSGTDVCTQLLASAERQLMHETIEAEEFFGQTDEANGNDTNSHAPSSAKSMHQSGLKKRL